MSAWGAGGRRRGRRLWISFATAAATAAGSWCSPPAIFAATFIQASISTETISRRRKAPHRQWNSLVVGACTDKITITHPDYAGWAAVAPAGDLSPASRTSAIWDRQWPIRPDVVFEGGNFAHDGVNPAAAIDDLQLVTTHYRPNVRLFEAFGDTSGATALGAHLAAESNVGQAHPLAGDGSGAPRAIGRMDAGHAPALRWGGFPGPKVGDAAALRLGNP